MMGSFTYKWKLPITRCWPHLFQQTDRQAGKASAYELLNYFKLPHFHLHIRPVRPATTEPVGFFFLFPPPHLCCAPTTRSRVTLIGSGEFKIPECDWACHHPGQHCKATTYPSYHRAAQHSRKPDSGYCLANSAVYFTQRWRITPLWIIDKESTKLWITVLLLLPLPDSSVGCRIFKFDTGNLLRTVGIVVFIYSSNIRVTIGPHFATRMKTLVFSMQLVQEQAYICSFSFAGNKASLLIYSSLSCALLG